jgi:hypothetical protein
MDQRMAVEELYVNMTTAGASSLVIVHIFLAFH